ncbi:MAG: SGNH/GDSL hydrolase family protein [Arachnia sp.]
MIGRAVSFAAGLGIGALGARYLAGRRTVNRHVAEYAAHWGDRPSDYPENVLHYVALGDSAAQGVGASHVFAGYVGLVADRLTAATGRPVALTNLSVSGATSGDVVEHQLPVLAELPFTPDILTLDIGGNDLVYFKSPAYFEESLTHVLAALPAGSFVGDVPWGVVPGLSSRSDRLARLARGLIATFDHRLVGLHELTRDLGAVQFLRNSADDWFHPNDQGYLVWADAYWGAIVASGRLQSLRLRSAEPDSSAAVRSV